MRNRLEKYTINVISKRKLRASRSKLTGSNIIEERQKSRSQMKKIDEERDKSGMSNQMLKTSSTIEKTIGKSKEIHI